MDMKLWNWNTNLFESKCPPVEGWYNLCDAFNHRGRDGIFEIIEWVFVALEADFINEASLCRVILVNQKVLQLHIKKSSNKQAFLGFAYDKEDDKVHLMGLWLKGEQVENDFLAAAEAELSQK